MPPVYRVSTIPAAKAAIVDALDAAWYPGDLPAVQISYGEPRERQRECIIVGDTHATGDSAQTWAALAGQGQRARSEDYALALSVQVYKPGDTCREAVERAFELFAVVEQTLRGMPTLGVVPSGSQGQVIVAEIRQPIHAETNSDEGWTCLIQSAVHVSARI